MKMASEKNMRHQQGFSLLEILVVIALIALIVTFAANQIFGQKDQASHRLAKSQLQTLSGKLDNYKLDVGAYPESLDQLVTNSNNAPNWLGPYVKEQELKDPWSNALTYQKVDNSQFTLTSFGADGVAGGDGTKQDIVVSP
jgi:general secretion pathway protein G